MIPAVQGGVPFFNCWLKFSRDHNHSQLHNNYWVLTQINSLTKIHFRDLLLEVMVKKHLVSKKLWNNFKYRLRKTTFHQLLSLEKSAAR